MMLDDNTNNRKPGQGEGGSGNFGLTSGLIRRGDVNTGLFAFGKPKRTYTSVKRSAPGLISPPSKGPPKVKKPLGISSVNQNAEVAKFSPPPERKDHDDFLNQPVANMKELRSPSEHKRSRAFHERQQDLQTSYFSPTHTKESDESCPSDPVHKEDWENRASHVAVVNQRDTTSVSRPARDDSDGRDENEHHSGKKSIETPSFQNRKPMGTNTLITQWQHAAASTSKEGKRDVTSSPSSDHNSAQWSATKESVLDKHDSGDWNDRTPQTKTSSFSETAGDTSLKLECSMEPSSSNRSVWDQFKRNSQLQRRLYTTSPTYDRRDDDSMYNYMLPHQSPHAIDRMRTPSPVSSSSFVEHGKWPSRSTVIDDSEVQPSDEKLEQLFQTEGAGLVNRGTTCFVNAAVQCLAHCRRFLRWLDFYCAQLGYKAGEVPQAEDSVDMNREIAFLIHKILSADSSTAIRPQRLLENLPQISHQFQTRRQEDAHEFFSQLLDKMERDAASKKLPKCELFNGSLVSRVVCSQCHLKSDTIDPFSTLSVGIHRCTELSECLSCFFSTETLSGDNAFECSSCSTHVDAEKQTYFKSLPDILTIQLKRFHHGDFIKDNHLVAFPETLNLFERLLPERRMTDNNTSSADTTETLTESQCWYDLTGILVHVGYTILSGHYYAFVRLVKEDGTVEFRKMDDQTVDTVGRNVAMCAEAYMLLYERRTSE